MQNLTLIETIRYEKGNFELLNLHLNRLARGAEYYKINYSADEIMQKLSDLNRKIQNKPGIFKIRLLLKKNSIILQHNPYLPPGTPLFIIFTAEDVTNIPLKEWFFKTNLTTNHKKIIQLSKSNTFDIIKTDKNKMVYDGYRSNIFVKINGILFTPRMKKGVLAGVYRRFLIDTNQASEADLFISDILYSDEIFLSNSLIHILPACKKQRENADKKGNNG